MFDFFAPRPMGKAFDYLSDRDESREERWKIMDKADAEVLRPLCKKARFVDALDAGQRNMTFKEAAELLFFNGLSVPPGDIAGFFIDEGLLCSLDDRGYEVTDAGWDSGCLRSEELWEQPEVGVSKRLIRVFVTVKGQLRLVDHFLKEGK